MNIVCSWPDRTSLVGNAAFFPFCYCSTLLPKYTGTKNKIWPAKHRSHCLFSIDLPEVGHTLSGDLYRLISTPGWTIISLRHSKYSKHFCHVYWKVKSFATQREREREKSFQYSRNFQTLKFSDRFHTFMVWKGGKKLRSMTSIH